MRGTDCTNEGLQAAYFEKAPLPLRCFLAATFARKTSKDSEEAREIISKRTSKTSIS
jgi:hypothetical protein